MAEICVGKANQLKSFADEVDSYSFEQTPDYSKLKHLLTMALLNKNLLPDARFDWSKFKKFKIPTSLNLETEGCDFEDTDEGQSVEIISALLLDHSI